MQNGNAVYLTDFRRNGLASLGNIRYRYLRERIERLARIGSILPLTQIFERVYNRQSFTVAHFCL